MQDLQNMMNSVITTSLTLKVKKTKYMIVTKIEVPNEHVYVEGERLERIERYHYLGISVICSVDYCSEIKIRIEKARESFVKIKKLLRSRILCIPSPFVWYRNLDTQRILRAKTRSLRDVDIP